MTIERRHNMGAGGFCLCPKCGKKIPHHRGISCDEVRCPQCDAKMIREGSYHHQLIQRKKAKKKS